MKRFLAAAFLSVAMYVPVALAQNDKPGSKDYPGLTRMPDHFIYLYDALPFDALKFRVTKDGKASEENVEGKVTEIQYVTKKDIQKPSALQIVRNYQNAVKANGGVVLDDRPGSGWHATTMRLVKGGSETWISIEARTGEYWLKIAERQAMKQDVTLDAASMASGLGTEGKVALYGLYFDTGKSDLKPESDPTLAEIAKLLELESCDEAARRRAHGHGRRRGGQHDAFDVARAGRDQCPRHEERHSRRAAQGIWQRPLRTGRIEQDRRRTGEEPAGRTGGRGGSVGRAGKDLRGKCDEGVWAEVAIIRSQNFVGHALAPGPAFEPRYPASSHPSPASRHRV